MRSEKNIFIAFILNLLFSAFEYFGAVFTGSVAIMSDAVHDFGDALSIGTSYFLEVISKKRPDEKHTYGYARYSVLGSLITTLVLMAGSAVVIYNAVNKIKHPSEIDYDVMLIFALIGLAVNLLATFATRGGKSINQKAVNLHMLEDVLGWAVVLIGAVLMRFTGFALLDPIMSIGVALFIMYRALINARDTINLFLENTPIGISVTDIKDQILKIDKITDVHHIHIWSLDGQTNYATMHIVTDDDGQKLKETIRALLAENNITHVTLELEHADENCGSGNCNNHIKSDIRHIHHH